MPIGLNNDTVSLGYVQTNTGMSVGGNLNVSGSVNPSNIPLSFKNLIINGNMNVHQRGTTVSSITASSYNTADRWVIDIGTAFGTWTQTVELNDAPTGTELRKSLRMLCTSNVASPTAGNFIKVRQTIEAQNCNILKKGTSNAESFTVSFWVKSNVTGTYVVEIEDQTNNRLTNNSYTINSINVWERKSITFSRDTTGALNNDNGVGLLLAFYIGAGSSWTTGTLQTTWGTNSVTANRAAGQVNVASANNNYWQITGIQMEVGTVATVFETLPPEVQLIRCQRYYNVINYISGNGLLVEGYGGTSNPIMSIYSYPVRMRTVPGISQTGTFSSSNVASYDFNTYKTDSACTLRALVSTTGFAFFFMNSTDDSIIFNCEL